MLATILAQLNRLTCPLGTAHMNISGGGELPRPLSPPSAGTVVGGGEGLTLTRM